jgi:tol-pal system protein YbgF
MPFNRSVLLLTLLLGACASTPPEADPALPQVNGLDARIAHMTSNQVELSQRLDQIQSELREMSGRMEVLEHSNEQLSRQQRDLYADLDRRIAAAGGPAAGVAAGSAGSPRVPGSAAAGAGSRAGDSAAGDAGDNSADEAAAGSAAGGASAPGSAAAGAATGAAAAGAAGTNAPSSVEQAVYSQAFDALKAGSYSVAITGFRNFLTSYPSSPLAENAQYWLGEAYYVNRDYDSAAGAFRSVLKKWPDSRRAPDALLKLGFSQFQQKQYPAARSTLDDVIKKYPGTDSAKLAADRLARIPAPAAQ